MFTAPSGPITAISAVGHAKFMSVRMCFWSHDAVRAAVRLPRDHRNFGHGRFGKGKQQFRAVLDDAVPFLLRAGQKSGNILEA